MSPTHRERLLAAVRGEAVDRVPVALWRHFPVADESAEGLARATIAFHEAYDFDLVKVTHASGYNAESWGAELVRTHNPEGTREYLRRVVGAPDAWRRLPSLAADHGALGRELQAIERVRRAVGPDVHVLPTIFSPLTVAKQLAGEAITEHLRTAADDLLAGLDVIADTVRRFASACLDHGADAIFFAAQMAQSSLLSDEEYERFGVPYDLAVLEAVRPRTDLVLLHLHGLAPMFSLANRYDVDIVNWHDRETPPSLASGLVGLRRGAVMGGLSRERALLSGSPRDVEEEIVDAIRQTGGRRLAIGAGCVVFVATPPANLHAARDAAGAHARSAAATADTQ